MSKQLCVSHIGKRSNHEDNFLFDGMRISLDAQKEMSQNRFVCLSSESSSRVRLYAVSDGMGGHNAGEVASRICVDRLAELELTLQSCATVKEVVRLCQSAIAEINTTLCDLSRKNSDLRGMGTTLVLLIVCDLEYAVLNIGDSRVYHFDGNSFVQLTKDNTEGQRMLDLGLLTRKELEDFPARKNLSWYIGIDKNGLVLQADEYYPAYNKGLFLLCSDGISDSLTDKEITNLLQSETDLASIGDKLIEAAVADEESDNATVILVPIGR